MAEEVKRGRGRPRKHEQTCRPAMMFRLRAELKDRVDEMASRNGYSLSEQLERLVEAALAGPDIRRMIREETAVAIKANALPTISHVTSVSANVVKGHEPGSRAPVQIGGDGHSARDWVWL